MKKILLSSLIAVMAVSAANAKIASTDYADSVADAAEASAKADTVAKLGELDATVSATDGVVTGVTQTDGKITGVASAKVTSEMIAENAAIAKKQLAADVQTSLTNADKATTAIGSETLNTAEGSYVSGKTLTGAINALDTAIKDVSGGNLKLGENAVDTNNIKNGAVTEDKLNTDLKTKINNKANSEDVYTKTDIDAKLGAEGATGQAIAAAAAAAAAAQATADKAVVANTAITAGTGTKITYDAKGLVTSSANLEASDIPTLSIAKIDGLQDALNSKQATLTIDTALNADSTNAVENKAIATAINTITTSDAMTSGIDSTKVAQIETNKTAIATLNGTGEGSLSKAVADGIAGITASVADGNGAIATLTQADGKVSVTRKLVATTDLDTTVNAAITDANNAASFMRSIQDASADQNQADKAYVLTASRGQDNTWIYTWEEIDRTALAVGD